MTRIHLLLHLLLFTPLAAASTGSVTGTVPLDAQAKTGVPVEKYRGKISGEVAEPPARVAGVWLEAPGLTAPAAPPAVSIAQTAYQFARSLVIVPVGTTISFPNNDPDYHNIYSLSRAKRFDLGRYKRGREPAPVTFDKAGFITLRCEIHEHMKAGIIVVDSTNFTTTDAGGAFTLRGVPPGSYTLHAQLDRKVRWRLPVQVVAGKTLAVGFPAR